MGYKSPLIDLFLIVRDWIIEEWDEPYEGWVASLCVKDECFDCCCDAYNITEEELTLLVEAGFEVKTRKGEASGEHTATE